MPPIEVLFLNSGMMRDFWGVGEVGGEVEMSADGGAMMVVLCGC